MAPTRPLPSPVGPAESAGGPDPAIAPGLPPGVIELAAERWRMAETAAAGAGLRMEHLDDGRLRQRLQAELTAPLRLEDWPQPTEPRPVQGGWIHAEVIDDDRSTVDALLSTLAADGPEAVASAAQELRLPVTPYRRPSGREPIGDRPPSGRREPAAPARSGTPLVVDLCTHWAGPLATALLAEAGAEVIKIDPSCRPDGFRDRPALYHHLNRAKEVIDLDLRCEADRARFDRLLARADLLVESFSRRVLPNLGYDRASLADRHPDLGLLSIKAFPADGPEAEWLAYGPGVHAASGLGLLDGRARPAPIAYPDLVAGVTAWATAMALLGDARTGTRAEVSLAGSIAPLIERAEVDGG